MIDRKYSLVFSNSWVSRTTSISALFDRSLRGFVDDVGAEASKIGIGRFSNSTKKY